MTTHQLVTWLLLLAAFYVICARMQSVSSQGCILCGGKGKHRDGCPKEDK